MSYYVIKGPRDSGQYLCHLPGYDVPQWWHERKKARRFPDSDSAWNWVYRLMVDHGAVSAFFGRVVRVNTIRDWKAERAMLRAENERLRMLLADRKAPGGEE